MTTAERLIREGMQIGRAEAWSKGKAEGVTEGKLEAAKNMLLEEIPLDKVLKITGLTLEDLRNAGIVK